MQAINAIMLKYEKEENLTASLYYSSDSRRSYPCKANQQ